MWWFSHPTGDLRVSGDQVSWDLSKDFNFSTYSTFTGAVDWHFKRKHHFTFAASPVYSSKSATITRDITFQGVTYHTGATVNADLNSLTFSPGYQYDFIRRRQGYLGLAVSLHLLDTSAKLAGIGTVNGVTRYAPLPVPRLLPCRFWDPRPAGIRFTIPTAFLCKADFRGCTSSATATSCSRREQRRCASTRDWISKPDIRWAPGLVFKAPMTA